MSKPVGGLPPVILGTRVEVRPERLACVYPALRFVTKRDFDCEQVKQQTSQPELKHFSVVRLCDVTDAVT